MEQANQLSIETRIKILKAIQDNGQLKKEADMFSAVINAISAAFSDVFNPNDISGSLIKIGTTAVMGYFFGIWWSIFTAVLEYGFGIDIRVILETIITVVSKFLGMVSSNKEPVDVDRTSEQLTDHVVGQLNLNEEISNQPIGSILSEASKKEGLIKEAQFASLFGRSVGRNALRSFLSTSSGGFIKKIIMTIIKGLLVGAGVGIGTSAAIHGVKQQLSPRTETKDKEMSYELPKPKSEIPQLRYTNLVNLVGMPSGKGEVYHINDADMDDKGKEAWFIPNNAGNFGKVLWYWLFEIYPRIPPNVEKIIYRGYIPAYNSIRQELSAFNNNNELNTSREVVRIPPTLKGKRIHTIKDIIDVILGSIVV